MEGLLLIRIRKGIAHKSIRYTILVFFSFFPLFPSLIRGRGVQFEVLRTMRKTIFALALAAGITTFAGNAKAALNYYFTANSFSFGGTSLTGEIFGITPDSASTPTSVKIFEMNGVTINTTYALPLYASYGSITLNSSGDISAADFRQYYTPDSIGLYMGDQGMWGASFSSTDYALGNTSAFTFTPVTETVPEPSTYALFGIGAIGLLMVMRRKKTA